MMDVKIKNQKLLKILALVKKGWDGPESQEINATAIKAAQRLIEEIDPQPELYGTSAGSIVLSYLTEDGIPFLEVTVFSSQWIFITNRVLNLWEESVEKAISTTRMIIRLCEE